MKKLAVLLLAVLICGTAQSQSSMEVIVRPQLSLATIDSVIVTAGRDTIASVTKPFGSVEVGQSVWGPGIPYGTTVSALPDTSLDSMVILSTRATSTTALNTLNFGYFSATAYGSGDWLGLPFALDVGPSAYLKLENVTIADSSDDFGNFDIALFRVPDESYLDRGLDNAAATLAVGDIDHLVAYITVASLADLGNIRFLTTSVTSVLPSGKLYGRLVSKATPTFNASIKPAVLRFRFSQ